LKPDHQNEARESAIIQEVRNLAGYERHMTTATRKNYPKKLFKNFEAKSLALAGLMATRMGILKSKQTGEQLWYQRRTSSWQSTQMELKRTIAVCKPKRKVTSWRPVHNWEVLGGKPSSPHPLPFLSQMRKLAGKIYD